MAFDKRHAFTLVELLAMIAVIGALVTVGLFYVADYITTSKQVADKRTLVVLNDALNRYKCEGGDINALTSGAPIRNILAKLQQPITWNGLTHQILQPGKTYSGRSIDSIGNLKQYRFTRFNTYTEEQGGTSPIGGFSPTGVGQGVVLLDNTGTIQSTVYNLQIVTTTGHYAVKDQSNNITFYAGNGSITNPVISGPILLWSCTGASDSTKSGRITSIQLTGPSSNFDFSGFDAPFQLTLNGESEQNTINFSGLSNLTSLTLMTCALTSLNVSNCSALTSLTITNCPIIDSVNLTGCTALNSVSCYINTPGLVGDASALNTLYTALPNKPGASIAVGSPAASKGSDTSIASGKGWTVWFIP